jgi:hypothetical protein
VFVAVVAAAGRALPFYMTLYTCVVLYVGGNCSRVLVAHHSTVRSEYMHSATAAFQRSAVVMLCVLIVFKQSYKYSFLAL